MFTNQCEMEAYCQGNLPLPLGYSMISTLVGLRSLVMPPLFRKSCVQFDYVGMGLENTTVGTQQGLLVVKVQVKVNYAILYSAFIPDKADVK
eukprot:5327077-Pleurochrysis_carterae.AAC.1